MTFDFTGAMRSLQGRPNPNFDPYDPLATTPGVSTYQALGNVVQPMSLRSVANLPMTRASSAAADPVVPGPLGTWALDSKTRPYQQIGKFGVNLLGPGPGTQPGAASPYQIAPPDPADQLRAMADPNNPDNRGFIEGLLGAFGGLFGEVGRGVGSFAGSVLDAPLEAAGNIIGLPVGALMSQYQPPGANQLDPDIQAIYDEAAKRNPLNGLLLWSSAAKAQWVRDADNGKHTGLYSDFGPATALTDQLGQVLQALSIPMRWTQRALTGTGDGGVFSSESSIRAVERALASGDSTWTDPDTGTVHSTSPLVRNEAWARVQQRLAHGDFGPVGSKEARDKAIDQLIVEGSILRDAGDLDQEGFATGQGLADITLSLVTDPLLVLGGLFGATGKLGKMATMTANSAFWKAVPEGALPEVLHAVEEVGMKAGGFDSPERVWSVLGRAGKAGVEGAPAVTREQTVEAMRFEQRVLGEVLNKPEFASWADEGRSALGNIEQWRNRWGPALRPITATVNTLNDPLRLFGMGRADRWANDVYSAQATEGIIRGQGSLDAHAKVQDLLGQAGEDFRAKYDRGIGTYAAYEARVYHRAGLVSDLMRRVLHGDGEAGDLMLQHMPDEAITARLNGSTAGDVASGLEKQMLRVRPLYLATRRGGEAEALARGRAEGAARLRLMGMPDTLATQTAEQMGRDELSLLDGAYFGHAMDQFVTFRNAAQSLTRKGRKGVNYDTLTMIGPRTLTEQEATSVLEAVARGDVAFVRQALQRYDLLYENLSENMSDSKVLKAVEELVRDQQDAGALPRIAGDIGKMTPDLQHWAQINEANGYRLGYRPSDIQKLWRVTQNAEGGIVGINPWIEPIAQASDVPTYGRAALLKDLMFHNVRGERIMADSRVRLAQFTSRTWGLPRAQSDALFARFLRMAQESGITPRGMTPEQVYKVVHTHNLPAEVMEGVGVREAVEALLYAFEGNWRRVGLSQKFTGSAKTTLGGQSNWLGLVAERIYPMVRFTLNPLFQAQEMTEPFIMNVIRGVKPGFRASELDTQTLDLIETLIRDSKYAYDDQIERDAVLLWGADSARQAFGANSRLGRMVTKMTIGGLLNVKEVKRVNYARALRTQLGREFEQNMDRVMPGFMAKMRAHYRTSDPGVIAVKYLTDKSYLHVPLDALKPESLGARVPISLDTTARLFDDVADGADLRERVRAGLLDETDFRDTLTEAGAHPDYASRAFATASSPVSLDEFWDEYRTVYRGGNQRGTDADRAILRAFAETHGMSEEEFVAKTYADTPMSVDSRTLGALAADNKRWFQLMAEARDESVGRTRAVDERIAEFRRTHARTADREHYAIVDDDGTVLDTGSQEGPWTVEVTGVHHDAGIDIPEASLALLKGRTLLHNHPSHTPFSPADIASSINWGAKEAVVTSPGITYTLTPPAEGWWTPEFRAMFGEPTDAGVGTPAWFQNNYPAMREVWSSGMRPTVESLRKSPYYAARDSDYFNQLTDALAVQAGVQDMADRFGWTFHTDTHFRLPVDDAERHALLQQMEANAPAHLARDFPYAFRSEPLQRHDLHAGASVAMEYASEHRPWLPADLPEPVQRKIMDGWEDWFRGRVLPMLGAAVTDVRRSRGGWLSPTGFTDTVNSVLDVFAPDDMVRDVARVAGYLLKQDAVVVSRPKVGRLLADPAQDERWALHFVADRELSGDEAATLARNISDKAPTVAGWGSSVVTTADGRTAIRFVNYAQDRAMAQDEFLNLVREEVDRYGSAARQQDFGVTAHPAVVDYHYLTNDWSAAPDGGQYLEGIAGRRPDVRRQLEYGLAQESEGVLAHLARANGAVLGPDAPDFRIAGDWRPAPLADRVSLSLPGGREGILEPGRELSLWEQSLLKGQAINASDLYASDPELAIGLFKAITRSKYKALTGDNVATEAYNAMAFSALTANAALDTSEGALALVRATPGSGAAPARRTLERMTVRANRLAVQLPEEFRRDPAALGTMFELDEGLRVTSQDLSRADWLTLDERVAAERSMQDLDQRMAAASAEERVALAKEQNRLVGKETGKVRIEVHPYPVNAGGPPAGPVYTSLIGDSTAGLSYTTLKRPGVRFKATTTRTQWGNILRWLDSGIFDPGNLRDQSALSRFLTPQQWESRSDWALRMSAILPGIDMKTSLLAAMSAGPSLATHGALDTHILRFIAEKATARGEMEALTARLGEGMASHLREETARAADGLSTAFRSPRGQRISLVPNNLRDAPWGPEKLAAMQQRLSLIPDPEMAEMFNHPGILNLVARASPEGRINLWGGDYAVLEEYFQTTLRQAEADALRAAGHEQAAAAVEAMSGGEWQWFKWDQIRSAGAGVPLDPHVGLTRSADLMPARAGAELDRNLGIARTGSPYDPVNSMVLQQIDGRVLGANQIMEDGRRILLATQFADGRTGLHELAHSFEQYLDPSMRESILDQFRVATGSKRQRWSREVSEWWADSLLAYGRTAGKGQNPALRSSFEYVRKTLNRIEAGVKAEKQRGVLTAQRSKAIASAQKAVTKVTPAVREAEAATKAASRVYEKAARDLRRARARAGVTVLEERRELARETASRVEQSLREARAGIRVAKREAKEAEVRASEALGTRTAGGLRVAANRKRAAIPVAEERARTLSRELEQARNAAGKANRAAAAARRRTPLSTLEQQRDAARSAMEAQTRRLRAQRRSLDQATKALDKAKATSTVPNRQTPTAVQMSPEMRDIWATLTTPPASPSKIAGTGQPYDLQQEAVYQAARLALSRAEENAFTLHYYKRGRSMLERSINHPYFGLYPASYMWGKVLPEMTAFLLKHPFGVDVPLGGLALSNNIYRSVMVQQQYDEDFRRTMAEQTDLWHFVSMLTPSLPWEVPVNAPLWMRRLSENALTYDDKLADYQAKQAAGTLTASDKPPPLQDINDVGNIGAEMLQYAFGPANAIKEFTGAISSTAGAGTGAVNQAVSQVEQILGSAPVDQSATLPGVEPPITGLP